MALRQALEAWPLSPRATKEKRLDESIKWIKRVGGKEYEFSERSEREFGKVRGKDGLAD